MEISDQKSRMLKERVLQALDDLITCTCGEQYGIQNMVGTQMPDRLEVDNPSLMLDCWDLREKLSGHPSAMGLDQNIEEDAS